MELLIPLRYLLMPTFIKLRRIIISPIYDKDNLLRPDSGVDVLEIEQQTKVGRMWSGLAVNDIRSGYRRSTPIGPTGFPARAVLNERKYDF